MNEIREQIAARLRSRPALGVLLVLLVLYPWFYHHVLPQSSQWIPTPRRRS